MSREALVERCALTYIHVAQQSASSGKTVFNDEVLGIHIVAHRSQVFAGSRVVDNGAVDEPCGTLNTHAAVDVDIAHQPAPRYGASVGQVGAERLVAEFLLQQRQQRLSRPVRAHGHEGGHLRRQSGIEECRAASRFVEYGNFAP